MELHPKQDPASVWFESSAAGGLFVTTNKGRRIAGTEMHVNLDSEEDAAAIRAGSAEVLSKYVVADQTAPHVYSLVGCKGSLATSAVLGIGGITRFGEFGPIVSNTPRQAIA